MTRKFKLLAAIGLIAAAASWLWAGAVDWLEHAYDEHPLDSS